MSSQGVAEVENPVRLVDVSDLKLDVRNPRRTLRDYEMSQGDLIKELYNRFDIDDLLASLATYGYFSEEPLIAIPEFDVGVDVPPFVVVEGNRRLAALKLLLSSEARNSVRIREVPEISEIARLRLNPVPVKIYATRAEVLPYLGVRHIVGVKQWEALAKARYIKDLIQEGLPFTEVAHRVGSGRRTDIVRRWLLTLNSIEQANKESYEPWDEADEQFGFSLLYTSLGYRSVREYLGITPETFSEPLDDPIPEDQLENLLDHMKDLYGPPPGRPRDAVVRESRQIKDLAQVYESPDAVAALRAGASLQVALRKTVDEDQQLVEFLREANSNLLEANVIAPQHVGHESAIQLARQCKQTADTLVPTLVGV